MKTHLQKEWIKVWRTLLEKQHFGSAFSARSAGHLSCQLEESVNTTTGWQTESVFARPNVVLILVIHSWVPWCSVSKMQAYKNPKNYFHTVDQRQGQISPLNIYPSVPPWNLVQDASPAKNTIKQTYFSWPSLWIAWIYWNQHLQQDMVDWGREKGMLTKNGS